ncbi:MAG TPA: RluA family pseudouridine synthase [Burkholderiaceae bacterium]|nr:RluA family pseudouridine synthase [Burkholderiaceae bacterium]
MQTVSKRRPGARPGLARTNARSRVADSGIGPDQVSYVTVGDDGAGQRLDNFLLKLAKGVPKSHIYRIVRSGEVRINRARAGASQRLAVGDRVRIPPLRLAASNTPAARPAPVMPPILFEDEHLLVVDKAAGFAVHGGSGVTFGIIEQVRSARPNQPFLELVHRLDRETSGILLLAKTRRALVALHEQLREGKVDKRYLALVHGTWTNARQHVRVALRKSVTAGGERRVSADPAGLPSHTVINLKQRFRDYTLLEAELRTGRTHQIRVHLAHLGYPIAGDDKYGDFELNKRLERGEGGPRLRRMFLHAAQIRFRHPVSDEPMDLLSPLPRDCEDFLRELARA